MYPEIPKIDRPTIPNNSINEQHTAYTGRKEQGIQEWNTRNEEMIGKHHFNYRYGRSTLHPTGKLTHTLYSNDAPQSDDTLKNTVRKKIIGGDWLYTNLPDPIVFIPVVGNPIDKKLLSTINQNDN